MDSFGIAPDGYPMVDLDSDEEFGRNDSSDDDLDVLAHGTPEQKRRLRRISLGQESSSDDDFEKEMGAELSATINRMKTAAGGNENSATSSTDRTGKEDKFYNKEYFDSDSDDEMKSADKKDAKHPVIDNDDLLYDPNMDREDEMWVQNQRGYLDSSKQKSKKGGKNKGDPFTDAVLNCPACMSLLCLDCQRHDIYKNQYRAMFVKNCTVNMSERLRYPIGGKGKRRKKTQQHMQSPLEDLETIDGDSKDNGTTAAGTSEANKSEQDEIFYPVKCEVCDSEVGVFDTDEVYHFFNVLSSHS